MNRMKETINWETEGYGKACGSELTAEVIGMRTERELEPIFANKMPSCLIRPSEIYNVPKLFFVFYICCLINAIRVPKRNVINDATEIQ